MNMETLYFTVPLLHITCSYCINPKRAPIMENSLLHGVLT